MRKILFFTFLCLTLNSYAISQKDLTAHEKALLSGSAFKNAVLSPDAKKVAIIFSQPQSDTLVVLNRNGLKAQSATDMGKLHRVSNVIWANNKKIVLQTNYSEGYLTRFGKTKSYIYSLNYKGSSKKQIYPPYSKNSNIYANSSSNLRITSTDLLDKNYLILEEMFIRSGKVTNRLVRVNINSGKHSVYRDMGIGYGQYIIDNNFNVRLALSRPKYDKRLIQHKALNGTWIKKDRQKVFKYVKYLSKIGFNKKNDTLYFIGARANKPSGVFSITVPSKGTPSNLKSIFEDEESNVLDYYWDSNKKSLLYVDYGLGAPKRKYIKDNKQTKILKNLQKAFPTESIQLNAHTGSLYFLKVKNPKKPFSYYFYDSKKQKVGEFLRSNEKVDLSKTTPMTPISYTTRDGVKIHGFLHHSKKNAPLLINIHGGPFGRSDDWGFDYDAQFFINQGYSYLRLNYRGSGGRGQEFIELGKGTIGTKMQYDIIDAAKWAVKKKITKPGQICLWGVSYGGSSSVMSFLMRQDLFKCALSSGGVYNFHSLLSMGDIKHSNYGKKYWKEHLPESKAERLKHSPIYLVKNLKKPLYIIHGKEDLRVPIQQARELRKELKKHKKSFKYKEHSNVGHWFLDQKKKQNFYKEALSFFDESFKKTQQETTP